MKDLKIGYESWVAGLNRADENGTCFKHLQLLINVIL